MWGCLREKKEADSEGEYQFKYDTQTAQGKQAKHLHQAGSKGDYIIPDTQTVKPATQTVALFGENKKKRKRLPPIG